MLGLLQYAANAIVLLLYFILQRPHPFADFSNVAAWPIVAFALFLILHVVAFSVHDTTRPTGPHLTPSAVWRWIR